MWYPKVSALIIQGVGRTRSMVQTKVLGKALRRVAYGVLCAD